MSFSFKYEISYEIETEHYLINSNDTTMNEFKNVYLIQHIQVCETVSTY